MSVKPAASAATTTTAEEWAAAHRKAARARASMSAEEDAALTALAISDPDNPPIPDDAVLRPWMETEARTPVLIDREIVERFRRTGNGWEERLNLALRSLAPTE